MKRRVDVNMARARRWLLAVMAVSGLASCSDRMPNRPLIAGPGSPPNSGAPLDSTLEANRALWSASGIDSYRYRFRWECFCVLEHIRVVDITVKRGTLVSVVDAETGATLGPEDAAQYRTIDGLFDFVREAIDFPAHSVQAAFDPDLGYPAVGYVDYVAPIADDEQGFRVYGLSRFKPW